MIRKGLSILFLIIVPMLLGTRKQVRNKHDGSIYIVYNRGCICMLFLATLIYEFCLLNKWGFDIYEHLIISSIVFISIILIFSKIRNKKKKKINNKLQFENIILLLVILSLLVFQLSAYLFTGNFDQNDSSVEIVNTIISNNNFFYISPYTGDVSTLIQPLYTPAMLFYAFLCKVSNLHPTLLVHIIIPFWILTLFSSICYEYGRELFGDKRKAIYLVLVVQILNILGTYGKWIPSSLLLHEAWREESILILCLVPWMMLELFWIFQDKVISWNLLFLVVQFILLIFFERSGVFYTGLLLAIALLIIFGRKIHGHYRTV